MSWLPQMIEHRCSVGERGGFFERLRRRNLPGSHPGARHAGAASRAGADFGFGRARESSQEGLFRVAVRYEDEALGRACLEIGRRLCLAAIHDRRSTSIWKSTNCAKLADASAWVPALAHVAVLPGRAAFQFGG